jgi:hypothetical protein
MSHPHVCCRGRFRSSGADPHPSAVVSTCRPPAAGCGHSWWGQGRETCRSYQNRASGCDWHGHRSHPAQPAAAQLILVLPTAVRSSASQRAATWRGRRSGCLHESAPPGRRPWHSLSSPLAGFKRGRGARREPPPDPRRAPANRRGTAVDRAAHRPANEITLCDRPYSVTRAQVTAVRYAFGNLSVRELRRAERVVLRCRRTRNTRRWVTAPVSASADWCVEPYLAVLRLGPA